MFEQLRDFHMKWVPRLVCHFWWMVHNCIAHPLMGIAPVQLFFNFHDYTSRWMLPSNGSLEESRGK
jgi:hypothetical protein